MTTQQIADTLAENECWALLRATDIGRLAIVVRDRPEIFPLNFVVDHGTLVFRSAQGTKVSAVWAEQLGAIEVDGYDRQAGLAWSVIVHGRLEPLISLELIDADTLPLHPLQADPKPCFARLVPDEITGRQFRAADRAVRADAVPGRLAVTDVEAALAVAARAPSIHNTQPWSWEFDGDTLSLRADRSRQLAVADPDGHSLLISCGAALSLTECALKAGGWSVTTERLPDPDDPDLLARFIDARRTGVDDVDRARVDAAMRRHSDRRPFSARLVTEQTSEALRAAADDIADSRASGVHTHFPTRADERTELAVAVSWADRVERDDPAYLAEMARWVHDDEGHGEQVHRDGVPLTAVPDVDPEHPRHVDVPVRDFQVGVSGRQLIEQDVDERALIAVLLTDDDSALAHLRAGEAMMRLMLEAERLGVACCPLSQAVDLAAFRSRVQTVMGWVGSPQMMLRLGYPAIVADEGVPTPRRPVASLLQVGSINR